MRFELGTGLKREFDWELIPYDDACDGYSLWVDHHPARAPIVALSNRRDPQEEIELDSRSQIDELIARLTIARDAIFPLPPSEISDS